ncbi:HpcH/HpaI aldolase family protein [Saccharothrix obliqua]|uniref:HpcH/HpaI aldolase family protein n=1 Tax=Saccharothrix obliqua TaxID=2861747 RepID=UPI001C5CE9A8|nr:aldolase/citrate lyase family protein [Saccharothrix obliqua]MBW4720429.1 2-dehydro-3-deoxyglucarate aldolase [Saccharothrix obliqua]
MIRKNRTLELIRRGEPAVGTWLQLHSVHATRLLVAQGFHRWMLVDFEHTPVDHTTAAHIFSTIADLSGGEITPLARVAAGSVDQVKQALDAGSQGVIVPMVNSAAEAEAAVRAARFPPAGVRGAGGLAPHLGFGVNRPTYLAEANREILVGVQIETVAGLANVREIAAVDGVDLVFVGPFDLHMALELPSKVWSTEPRFLAAVHEIITAAKEADKPVGVLCAEAHQARDRLAEGFTFVGMASDAHVMLTYAGKQYGALYGIEEPPETWCNTNNLDRLPDSLRGLPRRPPGSTGNE